MKKYKTSNTAQKDNLDRFYTKSDVAASLIGHLNLAEYKLIIEPSAGSGAFSDLIEGCVALDIEPAKEGIIKMDYFDYYPEDITGAPGRLSRRSVVELLSRMDVNEDRKAVLQLLSALMIFAEASRKDILVIGNPPFGKLGSMASAFIKHSATFADTIAFILPKSFKKPSFQKRVPKTFHLVKEVDVPVESFLFEGEDYGVPCVFQIWKNKYKERPKVKVIIPEGFEYSTKEDCSFAFRRVGVNAGAVFTDVESRAPPSHYFIKIPSGVDLDLLISELSKVSWVNASDTVGPKSISKQDVNSALNKLLKRRNK
jgi:hypothetical protein